MFPSQLSWEDTYWVSLEVRCDVLEAARRIGSSLETSSSELGAELQILLLHLDPSLRLFLLGLLQV